jgi:hypothetical protein
VLTLALAILPRYEKCIPHSRQLIRRLLVFPVGTASVERSLSTLNRILSSERCRLTADHVRQFVRHLAEGPHAVPDARDATSSRIAVPTLSSL